MKQQEEKMTLDVDSKHYQKACEAFWVKNDATQTPSERRYQLTISDNPKFIWYRNAKVGTRSTLTFLSNSNVNFTTKQAFNCYYPPALYQDYFKFAFVRNPWGRFVSAWKNKVLKGRMFGADPAHFDKLRKFENFVDFCASKDLETCNIHIRRQSCLIDLNNLDFLGRFEHFERDLVEIARILELGDDQTIPWKNASKNKRPWQEYYTDSLRDKVGEMYRRDIQIFSYKFDGSI